MNAFTSLQPSLPHSNKDYFKHYKVIEAVTGKKKITTIDWNSTGSKIAAGSLDFSIKVSRFPLPL